MGTQILNFTSRDWQAVATGTGYVTLTPKEESFAWFITDDSSEPTETSGHIFLEGVDRSINLDVGQYLWIKGRGRIAVTADNPV